MQNLTNIRIVPCDDTIKKIVQMADSYNLPHSDFDAHPHCTIIYSRDVVDAKDIKLPESDFPIIGTNAYLDVFETRDDGNVLVIEFDCEYAKQCFDYMKQKYNITTKYNEYKPHLTLQKNMITKNMVLLKITFDLYFDKLWVTNCD